MEGSLINHLMGSAEVPTVGAGVTVCWYTDREAGTIVWVSPSGKTFLYQVDKTTRTDGLGMTDAQEYSYEAQPAAPKHMARLGKKGWKSEGNKVVVGYRNAYRDFSF